MVRLPEHYRWSSVQANLGMIEDPLVTMQYLPDWTPLMHASPQATLRIAL